MISLARPARRVRSRAASADLRPRRPRRSSLSGRRYLGRGVPGSALRKAPPRGSAYRHHRKVSRRVQYVTGHGGRHGHLLVRHRLEKHTFRSRPRPRSSIWPARHPRSFAGRAHRRRASTDTPALAGRLGERGRSQLCPAPSATSRNGCRRRRSGGAALRDDRPRARETRRLRAPSDRTRHPRVSDEAGARITSRPSTRLAHTTRK